MGEIRRNARMIRKALFPHTFATMTKAHEAIGKQKRKEKAEHFASQDSGPDVNPGGNLKKQATALQRHQARTRIPQLELLVEIGKATDLDIRELARHREILKSTPRRARH
jgi:hypothetical protein